MVIFFEPESDERYEFDVKYDNLAKHLEYLRNIRDDMGEPDYISIVGGARPYVRRSLQIMICICLDKSIDFTADIKAAVHALTLINFFDCGRGKYLKHVNVLNSRPRLIDAPADDDERNAPYYKLRRALAMYVDLALLNDTLEYTKDDHVWLRALDPYFTYHDFGGCEGFDKISETRHTDTLAMSKYGNTTDMVLNYGGYAKVKGHMKQRVQWFRKHDKNAGSFKTMTLHVDALKAYTKLGDVASLKAILNDFKFIPDDLIQCNECDTATLALIVKTYTKIGNLYTNTSFFNGFKNAFKTIEFTNVFLEHFTHVGLAARLHGARIFIPPWLQNYYTIRNEHESPYSVYDCNCKKRLPSTDNDQERDVIKLFQNNAILLNIKRAITEHKKVAETIAKSSVFQKIFENLVKHNSIASQSAILKYLQKRFKNQKLNSEIISKHVCMEMNCPLSILFDLNKSDVMKFTQKYESKNRTFTVAFEITEDTNEDQPASKKSKK